MCENGAQKFCGEVHGKRGDTGKPAISEQDGCDEDGDANAVFGVVWFSFVVVYAAGRRHGRRGDREKKERTLDRVGSHATLQAEILVDLWTDRPRSKPISLNPHRRCMTECTSTSPLGYFSGRRFFVLSAAKTIIAINPYLKYLAA
ncbi:hypothetical protein M434DRAFT_15665 [Hypoxylon sp. CO27-5]|nr:hypothetical protein M434DRAFT_15665 [Hypoxylon sp. CO27-5]